MDFKQPRKIIVVPYALVDTINALYHSDIRTIVITKDGNDLVLIYDNTEKGHRTHQSEKGEQNAK